MGKMGRAGGLSVAMIGARLSTSATVRPGRARCWTLQNTVAGTSLSGRMLRGRSAGWRLDGLHEHHLREGEQAMADIGSTGRTRTTRAGSCRQLGGRHRTRISSSEIRKPGAHNSLDLGSRCRSVRVLPQIRITSPSSRPQGAVRICVPLTIAPDLRRPVVAIGPRHHEVCRATVPRSIRPRRQQLAPSGTPCRPCGGTT